jgi:hypothetical protein
MYSVSSLQSVVHVRVILFHVWAQASCACDMLYILCGAYIDEVL